MEWYGRGGEQQHHVRGCAYITKAVVEVLVYRRCRPSSCEVMMEIIVNLSLGLHFDLCSNCSVQFSI